MNAALNKEEEVVTENESHKQKKQYANCDCKDDKSLSSIQLSNLQDIEHETPKP